MLTEKQVELDDAGEAATQSSTGPNSDQDLAWAKQHLRWSDGTPFPDIANVLRILDGHEDFKGRYIYNETLNKVLDKGTLMLEWRISECCAVIQERFIPMVAESVVNNALIICANRSGVRK